MHAVLRNFVNAAGRRFLVYAVKMVERARSLADRVSLLNCFRHVGFGEQNGIAQWTPAGELRGNGRCESAA